MRAVSPQDLIAWSLRGAGVLAMLMLAWGALFIFEAASKTQAALEHARRAVGAYEGAMLRESMIEAREMMETSWARPLDWHAGAIEAESWLMSQEGVLSGDASYLRMSAAAAVDALAHGPVQPAAWTRLAALADSGIEQTRCVLRECLNYAWRAARMADDDVACPRLEIAYRNRLLRRDDIRITWVARADYWGRVMRACVSFMKPADMFRALMIAEQDRAAREARRQAR